MSKYNAIIKEQLQTGIIEPVEKEQEEIQEISKRIHYLPHHAVIREDKTTTKIRVVFYGSARSKSEELSINDCLERGPDLIPSLFDILIRFRSHPYVMVADIEKAFHMVSIKEEDRDVLRFLWLKNMKDEGPAEYAEYRFCRLVFGLKPSPAILGATIRHHLSNCNASEPEVIRALQNDLYVDDLATGTESEQEFLHLYKTAKAMMQKGGFNLRKWSSNSPYGRKMISTSEDVEQAQANREDTVSLHSTRVSISEDDESFAKIAVNSLSVNSSEQIKVLGVVWNFVEDKLLYSMQELVEYAKLLPMMKRSIVKLSARIFDPLGPLI